MTETPIEPATFDALRDALRTGGVELAVERLCDAMRERGDFTSLFYAELVRERVRLGLTPVPTAPASEVPDDKADAYEAAIRAAGRRAGHAYLAAGDISQAWKFFRMIGEPGPVRDAIDAYAPPPDADVQAVIDVAFYQGAHPKRGFDLFVERLGICSAITLTGGFDFPHGQDVRDYCVSRLVRALHEQLRGRLADEIAVRGFTLPHKATIAQLCIGQDWLSADDCYLVDTSHLSSVVHMAVNLPAGLDAKLAADLCAYGRLLAPAFQHAGETPFENTYADTGLYLAALGGDQIDEATDHFRKKAEEAMGEGITYPAEMLVSLLERVGRPAAALAEARRFLAGGPERPGSCSGVFELARRAGDYAALAEVARERDDPVHYLAGLIAADSADTLRNPS